MLLQDAHLLEKLAHFDRERVPERVVHAKGAGAHGYFEVTADVTKYTKARFLSAIGKKTEVFARFFTVGGEKGSADAERDPRGFAVKFNTEEGNYDLVGNNTPVFFIRDPLKFSDFIHTETPPIKIGKLVLNCNPLNYFAEVEQAAFCPGNLVPGIAISPDKMLQVRVFSYHDTHIHRLGPNYHLIPVNAPRHAPEKNYQRDGFMRIDGNGTAGPNYWPNSFGGPEPDPSAAEPVFEQLCWLSIDFLRFQKTILVPERTISNHAVYNG